MKCLSICVIYFMFCAIYKLTLVNSSSIQRSLTCEVNENVCQNHICNLRMLNQRLSLMDVFCFIEQAQTKVNLEYKIFKISGYGSKNTLLNVHEDVCKLLVGANSIPLLSRMIPSLRNYGFNFKRCPIKGNVTVRNYPGNLAMFSNIVSPGTYMATLNFSDVERNKHIITLIIDTVITN